MKPYTKSEVLNAIQSGQVDFFDLDARWRDDEDVVLAALKVNGYVLRYASTRCRNNPKLQASPYRKDIIHFVEALFCSINNLEYFENLRKKYVLNDEFLLEMKRACGDKFHSGRSDIDCLSALSAKTVLKKYRRRIIRESREVYISGEHNPSDFQEYKELPGIVFYSPKGKAAYLRLLSQPFSNIGEDFERELRHEQGAIAGYIRTTTGKGSFPERVVEAFLDSMSVEFAREVVFDWAKGGQTDDFSNRRYDFYVPSLSLIIEVHGIQHYQGGFESLGGRSLEEERFNDQYKRTLALKNGIEHYVELDASTSSFPYISRSIEREPTLRKLFPLSSVDWNSVAQNIKTSEARKVDLPLSNLICRYCQEWIDIIGEELRPSDMVAIHKELPVDSEVDKGVLCGTALRLNAGDAKALRDSKYYTYPVDQRAVPKYWVFQYGIRDLQAEFDKLISLGLLRIGSIRESMPNFTVNRIKRILIEYNLPTQGRKAELVDRLFNKIPEEKLEEDFSNSRQYILTEEGKKALEEYAKFSESLQDQSPKSQSPSTHAQDQQRTTWISRILNFFSRWNP